MSNKLGWWAISGEELLAALKRAAGGESPDLIYAEMYANGEHEMPDGGTEEKLRESVESEVVQLIHILHPNISCYEAAAALQNLGTWLTP